MQSTVHDRVMDWTAHGGFVGRLHGSYDQHTPGLCLFEKRKQQLLLLLDREVLVVATAGRLAPQHGLAVAR